MTFPKGQRAIITGASSGIGKEIALAFARAGIHVALVSRSAQKLAVVAQQACQYGVDAQVYPLDLAEVDRVGEQMAALATEFVPDILVNNASIAYTSPLIDTSLTDWQRILDVNLTSVFECIRAVVPVMRARHQGTIINISSILGKQAFPNWGAYSVSKFGIMGLTKTLAAEERRNGIRVTAICPSAVNTPIWDTETVEANLDRSKMLMPEIVAQSILQIVQLPASATIEELTILSSAGDI